MRALIASAGAVVIWAAATFTAVAAPQDGQWLIPPVDAPVARPFDAPKARYGPGHRGVDYHFGSGRDVRAAAAGTVAFAGTVAGVAAITIEHGDGLQTTYSRLSEIFLERGDVVAQGEFIGQVGTTHGVTEGLHFGVKLHDQYVDPQLYLGPLDVGEAIHLVPTSDQSIPAAARETDGAQVEGSTVACTRMEDAAAEAGSASAPNDNVAVAIGGITSEYPGAGQPEVYAVPGALGYPAERVFRFSYSGDDTYERQDTFEDLRVVGGRLRDLLVEIGRRWPGRDVDLIAHSQGGLVARSYLKDHAASWDPETPSIDHLITFASPHQGAPLAGEIDDLEKTMSGTVAMAAMAQVATRSGYVPDPHGVSTQQMRPGSEFLRDLAQEDVLYGTRVLTLAMPYDFIVPANHARYPGQLNRVVPGKLGLHHRMVVESPLAMGLARSFLRDAPEPCRTGYDSMGPAMGRTIGSASGALDGLFSLADLVMPPAPVGGAVARALFGLATRGGEAVD